MAGRIRSVKPEWLEDERMALASDAARVLSIALLLLADDHGNGRANRVVLAAHVFPGAHTDKLDAALRELTDVIKFVELYEVDSQSYFHIRNWAKHQRVDHPGKAQVPGPPTVSEKPRRVSRRSRDGLANIPENGAKEAEALAPRAIPSPPFPSDPDPERGAGENPEPTEPVSGPGPSEDLVTRVTVRARAPGEPPRPRHDLLGERLRLQDWAPARELRDWWAELQLDDRNQDSLLAAMRDNHGTERRAIGRWDEIAEGYTRTQVEKAKKAAMPPGLKAHHAATGKRHSTTDADFPTEADAAMRDRIANGDWGKRLAKELADGRLDAGLARRRIKEVEDKRAEQRNAQTQ